MSRHIVSPNHQVARTLGREAALDCVADKPVALGCFQSPFATMKLPMRFRIEHITVSTLGVRGYSVGTDPWILGGGYSAAVPTWIFGEADQRGHSVRIPIRRRTPAYCRARSSPCRRSQRYRTSRLLRPATRCLPAHAGAMRAAGFLMVLSHRPSAFRAPSR